MPVSSPSGTRPDLRNRGPSAGGFLIPGLWDSHVYIFSTPTEPDTALPLYLVNGITGIRDMDALWPIAEQQALQEQIEAGEVLGPRLILAGAWVDASPRVLARHVTCRYARRGLGCREGVLDAR